MYLERKIRVASILKAKQREMQKQAIHMEGTQRLVTERLKCSKLYFIW
jgi:hypothetical protein